MANWLNPALDYIPRWLDFQRSHHEQPGCVVAISHKGRIVLDQAFGYANCVRDVPLTPRHRFRVASHSKSFAAAGILKLRERGKLHLDDHVGRYVDDLNPAIAKVTINQLLSHAGGVVRDGPDSGQFQGRRPFLNAEELRTQLKAPPIIEPNSRFKYSNHGYGLLGLMIEAVTGEPYTAWIAREIVEAVGLRETLADAPIPRAVPVASGHTARWPLGRRVIVPSAQPTHAMAPAAGLVSTARDLVHYFGQLSPKAKQSVLSRASRREMIRRQWRDPHSSLERYYGLGTISGSLRGWDWFGHSGGFQGFITRTCMFPEQELAVSVLTNAVDGLAHAWLDGIVHILVRFAQSGPPERRIAHWTGRWWNLWGTMDLVPMGNKVLVAGPAFFNPFVDASELEVQKRDTGRIALAGGYASHGEPARLVRDGRKTVREVWIGGAKFLRENQLAKEMKRRYQ